MGEGFDLVCASTCRENSICRGAGSDAHWPIQTLAYEIGFAFKAGGRANAAIPATQRFKVLN